jgi:hypothetical protein
MVFATSLLTGTLTVAVALLTSRLSSDCHGAPSLLELHARFVAIGELDAGSLEGDDKLAHNVRVPARLPRFKIRYGISVDARALGGVF